ncbi:MAG: gluconokinase [Verrucomicrobiota bacterium]
MVVIICGVAGAGKTTIGKLLAQELGWQFFDADDFHSPDNIAKMKRGVALTDEDRQSWLEQLRALIARSLDENQNAVVACSALKKKYRDRLRVNEQVRFIFLRGDFAAISVQLEQRRGHFMNPELLRSQFADLEEPQSEADAITVELGRSPNELAAEIKSRLSL